MASLRRISFYCRFWPGSGLFRHRSGMPWPGRSACAVRIRRTVDTLAADPEALHASFAMYRALDATIAQNQQRATRRLTLPVLAIGGSQSLVIPGCGHHPAEEILAALTAFLAPYRNGTGHGAQPQGA